MAFYNIGEKMDIVRLKLKKEGVLSSSNTKIFGCEESSSIFIDKIGAEARECLALICIDSQNNKLNYSEVSIGSVNEVSVDYGAIFKIALLSNASSIIIAHNHPSNYLEPSNRDIEITKKIAELGKLFNIILIDSLIVGPSDEYYSIRSKIRRSHDL